MIVRRLSFNCSLPSFFIKYRVIFKFLSLKIPKLGNNLFFSNMFLCRVQHFFILEFFWEIFVMTTVIQHSCSQISQKFFMRFRFFINDFTFYCIA